MGKATSQKGGRVCHRLGKSVGAYSVVCLLFFRGFGLVSPGDGTKGKELEEDNTTYGARSTSSGKQVNRKTDRSKKEEAFACNSQSQGGWSTSFRLEGRSVSRAGKGRGGRSCRSPVPSLNSISDSQMGDANKISSDVGEVFFPLLVLTSRPIV